MLKILNISRFEAYVHSEHVFFTAFFNYGIVVFVNLFKVYVNDVSLETLLQKFVFDVIDLLFVKYFKRENVKSEFCKNHVVHVFICVEVAEHSLL